MMRQRFSVIVAIAVACLFIFSAPAQAHGAEDLYVDGVWATACPDGTVAIFMTIDNTDGGHPIALIGADSPMAGHGHLLEGNAGCTDAHIDRIVVVAGESVSLWDANVAVGLEMSEAYQAGEPISVTLTFDMLDDDLVSEGRTVEVTVAALMLESAPAESNIRVQGAWVRPTSGGDSMTDHGTGTGMGHSHSAGAGHTHGMNTMETAAPMFPTGAYMRLINRGMTPDRLVAASSPIAGITEVHETTMENDVMRMGEVEGIDLPVGEWVTLEPGGFHVMLIDLMRDLAPGEAIELTLTFESGEKMTIAVPVYDAAGGKMHGGDHHNH